MVKEKDDSVVIERIINCINMALDVTKDKTMEDIENDIALNSIVMFQMILIGEYSVSLSDEFKEKKQDIPWTKIKALRNNIVHDYGGIIYTRLYSTIKYDLPKLKEELLK